MYNVCDSFILILEMIPLEKCLILLRSSKSLSSIGALFISADLNVMF